MALKYVEGFKPLEVFRHPKDTVKAALEFPSITTAVFFVLAPWFLAFIAAAIVKLEEDFAVSAAKMAVGVVFFFIQAFVIFWLARRFGNKEKKLFEGVVSALSLAQLAGLVLAIFGFVVIIANPQIGALMNDWNSGSIQYSDLESGVWDLITANPIVGMLIVIVGTVLVFWMGLLSIYLGYLTVNKSTKASVFASILLYLIIFGLTAFFFDIANSIIYTSV